MCIMQNFRETPYFTGFRLALLKGLQNMLEETAEVISDTGLVDGLGIMPSPLEQMKELRAQLDSITGLEDDRE